jgi:hypothetical protein
MLVFTVGQIIDVRDFQGKWYQAQILLVEETRIFIHYLNCK